MSFRGYFRSDIEVAKALAEAGFYKGPVPDYTPPRPPFWLLQPIERWRWNKRRKEIEALIRPVHEEWARQGRISWEKAKEKL